MGKSNCNYIHSQQTYFQTLKFQYKKGSSDRAQNHDMQLFLLIIQSWVQSNAQSVDPKYFWRHWKYDYTGSYQKRFVRTCTAPFIPLLGLTSRTFDLLFNMIIDLKRSIDLRWLFDQVLLFILRWSCSIFCDVFIWSVNVRYASSWWEYLLQSIFKSLLIMSFMSINHHDKIFLSF